MSNRIEKLNHRFLQEISDIINSEIEFDEQILLTVTHVDLSPDLSQAKVALSVLPFEKSEQAISKVINKKQKIIQELNHRIKLKKIPRLIFITDDTEQKAQEVEDLINQI